MEPGDIVHMTQNEHKQKKEHNLDIWAPRTHTIMLTIQTISDEIRTPKSRDMQCKCWKKRDNRTYNDLQNTTQKTKDCATRTPQRIGGKLWCVGRVNMSCTTRNTRRVNVKRHDMGSVLDTRIYINEDSLINTTGATSGTGTAYPSGVHPRFLVGFALLDL
jgi:hypothetical protein